ITKLVEMVHHLVKSFKNFFKSSILSLLVILIILLLLTQMDQAFTMMVDLIESKWGSMLLSFFFINGLAVVLSHYPIYTYYAADLNNSGDYTHWHAKHPLNWWIFKRFTVYTFTTDSSTGYKPDNWANYFRYFTGILIHIVWIHFIISSFKPNIIFEDFPFDKVKIIIYLLLLIPFILYIYLKEKITKYEREKTSKELPEKLTKLYRKLALWYLIIVIACIIMLINTLTWGNFSPAGFILLLLTSYAFIFNYIFFRLLRTKFSIILGTLKSSKYLPASIFFEQIHFLEKSENYLLMFYLNFLVAGIFLFLSTLASILGWQLLNGVPILLAFFYFYYFIFASLGKYFFVARKKKLLNTKGYKAFMVAIFTIIILIIITNFTNVEVTTHELDLVENTKTEIPESVFLDSLKAKKDNTLFFIASHGGGLKANVWTLNVLNRLQTKTKGKLLNQSIAFSGASGGSLGLALYTGLYKEDGLDTLRIQKKIDSLAKQNYTSLDLTLTFGLDTYRKIWPLSQRIGLHDRPYYAMVKYQNNIQNTPSKRLSETSFRDYWKEAFMKEGYFPSLIMNTAGQKGNRGILWSVKQNKFDAIFPYAENLADLAGNKTLPFYQAVSTTNRFPIFSPAAKIKGHGHFIDAGAIDNSGLLGCLDLHNYLLRNKVLGDKQIAYIEIINSKSLYVNYLVEKFKKEIKIIHIHKNENESDNIIVDLETGLNLDKIPGYLSDYITNWEKYENGKLRYFKIFMPHKVSMDDVETLFKGKITNPNTQAKLATFLEKENNLILSLTEKPDKSFFDPWEFYEPTLSRHLSKSSLNYIDAILEHPLLKEQFSEIETLINTKKVEKNEKPELVF
ncbi:MAG: hypothetical protein KDC78_10940, partial [Aequorivita sp.]|nr:hypothetical protein [Aequorivita sp.]